MLSQNSTNIFAKNITCRGGTGIAFGSLGQYEELVSRHHTHASLQTHAIILGPHTVIPIDSRTTSRTLF